jgi:hypothetical protein
MSDRNPRPAGKGPESSPAGSVDAYPPPIEGGFTVDVGSRGIVRVAVTGLDVIGMEEQAPTLVKMNPDEARELAQVLVDAAREADGE